MSQLPPDAIVALVILGSCFAIAMAYGMSRFVLSADEFDPAGFPEPPDSQKEYMRDVRLRNQNGLMEDAAADKRRNGKNIAGSGFRNS